MIAPDRRRLPRTKYDQRLESILGLAAKIQRDGRNLTVRDVQDAFGAKSLATAHHWLTQLVQRGELRQDGRQGYRLVSRHVCPYCGGSGVAPPPSRSRRESQPESLQEDSFDADTQPNQ